MCIPFTFSMPRTFNPTFVYPAVVAFASSARPDKKGKAIEISARKYTLTQCACAVRTAKVLICSPVSYLQQNTMSCSMVFFEDIVHLVCVSEDRIMFC